MKTQNLFNQNINVMFNKRISTFILALVIVSFMSCGDDPDYPYNPLNGRTTAVFNPEKEYGEVVDIEGNIYKTIQIGDQVWMAENLRTTKYRNGKEIPNVTDNIEWANQTTGAYCSFNNTLDLDTIATYGRLYNWYAANDSNNIAPEGWRVPTKNDWNALIETVGGESIAALKLKEEGNMHWHTATNIENPSNSSGFTSLPGASRYTNLEFDKVDIYYSAYYWAKHDYASPFYYMYTFSCEIFFGYNFMVNGYSIRCIKE